MQVFVANPTQQNRHFHFRIPENPSIRQVELRPGSQAKLPGDFNEGQLASVIEQLERMGAVPATDPKALAPFGLVYTVGDKPIKSNQIDAAREQDVTVRQERAGDKAIEAGMALHAVAERGAPSHVESTTLEVKQLTDHEDGARQVKGGVDAEVKVSRSAQGRQNTRRRG